jgi:hypothetical protein
MALLDSNVEQILQLIYQLPLASKQSVFEALREDIAASSVQSAELDDESKIWLDSAMTEDLPEYNWGPAGIPEGVPIVCTADEGIVILAQD